MPAPAVYEYAVVRVVPRVERGEAVNVGAVLFCKAKRFLVARFDVDEARILALDPFADIEAIRAQLHGLEDIAAGATSAGPLAEMSQAERFRWLVAPRSTVVQAGEVHSGQSHDPAGALERLLATVVRRPAAPA